MNASTARCLCGDLAVEATLPSKWVAHCHCSLCRRAHGAAYVTWVGMEQARCRILDPENRLCWYASSPGAARGFCGNCGTTMLFRSDRWPGELHVARACFDAPVDRAPQAHAYWDDRSPWASIDPGDGLARITPG